MENRKETLACMKDNNEIIFKEAGKKVKLLSCQCFPSLQTQWQSIVFPLPSNVPNMAITEFANIVDPDEIPHNEPSYLDLHRLPS